MPPTPTTPRPQTSTAQQPGFWKVYSARAECPLSFAGSVLLHILFFVGLPLLVWWYLDPSISENSKPPEIDVVEVMGGGGGMGGTVEGPGMLNTGDPGRHEAGATVNDPKTAPPPIKIAEFEFKPLTPLDLTIPQLPDDTPDLKDDPFGAIDRVRASSAALLAREIQDNKANSDKSGSGFKGGDKFGPQGGAGGPKGPGFGSKTGSNIGTSPTGSILTDQRRRELRWKILASEDGDVHLKKLQALKVILVIPLRSKPGMAMRYDLSRPGTQGEQVRFTDDSKKVRWKNSHPTEMIALAKVLGLHEVPPFSVIYLPSDLEADMARRELAYQNLQEWQIEQTTWDVRERDGIYENEPVIVQQKLRFGIR